MIKIIIIQTTVQFFFTYKIFIKNFTSDDDGDDVVISSDMELKTALQYTKYNDIKLYIYCKGEVKKPETNIFIAPMPQMSSGNSLNCVMWSLNMIVYSNVVLINLLL